MQSATAFKADGFLFPRLWNSLQICSTLVPIGLYSDSLPIGFQVIAAPFNDRFTIAGAEELSKNCGAVWTSKVRLEVLPVCLPALCLIYAK